MWMSHCINSQVGEREEEESTVSLVSTYQKSKLSLSVSLSFSLSLPCYFFWRQAAMLLDYCFCFFFFCFISAYKASNFDGFFFFFFSSMLHATFCHFFHTCPFVLLPMFWVRCMFPSLYELILCTSQIFCEQRGFGCAFFFSFLELF